MIHVIDEMFPSIVRLRCWNHLLSDIDLWIKRHGGLKRDSSFYKCEARELFKCSSFNSFQTLLTTKKKIWDESYTDYFETCILPEADRFGRWKVEQLGFYCPYGGMTTNISEGKSILLFFLISNMTSFQD